MISESAMKYAEQFTTMSDLTKAVRECQALLAQLNADAPVHVVREIAERIVACHTYGHALRGLCEWRGVMLELS